MLPTSFPPLELSMPTPRLLFALTSTMALALVACGDDEETTDTTATSTSGSGGGATSSSTSGSGGAGQGGMGQGGMAATLNGCTRDAATEYTGMGTVDIGAEMAWDFGHQACIVVDVGTTVEWSGNLSLHPVSGGESPTPDAASPISMATPMNDTLSVTLSAAGAFPYYCINHTGMRGVVYVE